MQAAKPVQPSPAAPAVGVGDHGSLIGRVVSDKYGVKGIIGEGGMGAVYEAEHLQIGRMVALKVLHPVNARRSDAVARFHHEARVAGSIGHPNICEIYDVGKLPEGSPYLVMERLYGETLADRILKEGALPFPDAIDITMQVLSALVAAHAKGVVHRDIKPENIFLSQRVGVAPVAKLLDFGISKVGDDEDLHLTRTGMVMGTPYYMAPEQARGDRTIDQRVDLYAVGVIIYESLTGRRPFTAPNYNALLVHILSSTPKPMREIRPALPAGFDKIVEKALAKNREQRFQSAKEFLDALAALRDELQRSSAANTVAKPAERKKSIPPRSDSPLPGSLEIPVVFTTGSGPYLPVSSGEIIAIETSEIEVEPVKPAPRAPSIPPPPTQRTPPPAAAVDTRPDRRPGRQPAALEDSGDNTMVMDDATRPNWVPPPEVIEEIMTTSRPSGFAALDSEHTVVSAPLGVEDAEDILRAAKERALRASAKGAPAAVQAANVPRQHQSVPRPKSERPIAKESPKEAPKEVLRPLAPAQPIGVTVQRPTVPREDPGASRAAREEPIPLRVPRPSSPPISTTSPKQPPTPAIYQPPTPPTPTPQPPAPRSTPRTPTPQPPALPMSPAVAIPAPAQVPAHVAIPRPGAVPRPTSPAPARPQPVVPVSAVPALPSIRGPGRAGDSGPHTSQHAQSRPAEPKAAPPPEPAARLPKIPTNVKPKVDLIPIEEVETDDDDQPTTFFRARMASSPELLSDDDELELEPYDFELRRKTEPAPPRHKK